MHEIAIMQSALDLAGEHARNAGGIAIKRICLRVGILSGVVPDSLEFAFDVLKQGTMAEAAILEIERIPGNARCSKCENAFRLDELRFDCPDCSGILILGNAGTDLELSHLVIDGAEREELMLTSPQSTTHEPP